MRHYYYKLPFNSLFKGTDIDISILSKYNRNSAIFSKTALLKLMELFHFHEGSVPLVKFFRYTSVVISSVSSGIGARSGYSKNSRQDNLVPGSHQLGVGCGKLRTLTSVDKRIHLVRKNKKLYGSESIMELSGSRSGLLSGSLFGLLSCLFSGSKCWHRVYQRSQTFLAVKQIIATCSHILIFLVLMILYIL